MTLSQTLLSTHALTTYFLFATTMPTTVKTKVKLKKIELHPKQQEAFISEKQFIFVVTGIQAGKSTFGAIWLLREISLHPYDDFMIVASSYKVLTSATKNVFEKWAPKGAFKFYAAQEKFYYKINQESFGQPNDPDHGFVYLRSAENPNKLVGVTLRAFWFDEAGDAPKLAWLNLQNRVEILQGRGLITTTPYTFNWVKDSVELAIAGEETYDYINFPTSDNPMSNKKSIADKRRTMTREDFERLYMGKFTRPEGVIYDQFDPDKMILSRAEYDEFKKKDPIVEAVEGIDWGYTDPNVQIVINIHQSGSFVVVEEVDQIKTPMEQIIAKARLLSKEYKITVRYADSAYPQHIQQFNNTRINESAAPGTPHNTLYTVPVRKYPESNNQTYLQQGIGRVQSLMYTNKFYVLRDCTKTIEEIGSYSWDMVEDSMGHKVPTGTPKARQADHHVDPIRYVIDSHWVKRPIEAQPETTGTPLSRYLEKIQAHQQYKTAQYQRDIDAFSQDGL